MGNTRVQILAISKEFERVPRFIAPGYNELTHEFKVGGTIYQGILEKREMHKGGDRWICDTTPIRLADDELFAIQHGAKYDPDSPRDAFMLQIAKDSGYVAANKQSINPSVHYLYVHDEVDESRRKIVKGKSVLRALNLIYGMTSQEQSDFAFFMKQAVRNLSNDQIEAYCIEVAQDRPDTIIKHLENSDWKRRAFIEKCVQFGLLTQVGPTYKNGEEVIGMDQDMAVDYFKRKENKEFARQLAGRLRELGAPMAEAPAATATTQETQEKEA